MQCRSHHRFQVVRRIHSQLYFNSQRHIHVYIYIYMWRCVPNVRGPYKIWLPESCFRQQTKTAAGGFSSFRHAQREFLGEAQGGEVFGCALHGAGLQGLQRVVLPRARFRGSQDWLVFLFGGYPFWSGKRKGCRKNNNNTFWSPDCDTHTCLKLGNLWKRWG